MFSKCGYFSFISSKNTSTFRLFTPVIIVFSIECIESITICIDKLCSIKLSYIFSPHIIILSILDRKNYFLLICTFTFIVLWYIIKIYTILGSHFISIVHIVFFFSIIIGKFEYICSCRKIKKNTYKNYKEHTKHKGGMRKYELKYRSVFGKSNKILKNPLDKSPKILYPI